ncbi:MAG TPA: cellulase family glycosylhydrolase [Micromonosporaceae bacterium]
MALTAAGGLVAAVLVAITISPGRAVAAGTGTGYLHTSGNKIVDAAGTTVRLTGLNWFGMETDNHTFHGLWANAPATWRGQIDRMASLGFNTLRVPYAGDALRPGAQATSVNTYTNPDLVGLSPLQILDDVISYAGSKGMRVILDRHRPTAAGQTPLWYTSSVSEASIIADWQMLAQRYANNTTVIGADLFNEPHADGTDPNATGACWGCGDQSRDWRLAAQRIGNAILQTNSNWLIFVEGVSCISGGNANVWDNIPDPWQNCDWWGGNLSQAIAQPVQLNVANRVVYAPHDYGISVYDRQTWFNDPNFPNNLPGVWDTFWGNIVKQNVAPVMLGEFGSTLANPLDVQWMTTLVQYLTSNGMSFTYWSWNPNSGDTGGIALDDWYSINQQKYTILQPSLVPPVGGGTQTTTSTPPPTTPPPTTPPPTTPPPPSGGCSATYTIVNQYPGGFQAEITVRAGTTAISSWRVGWTFANGQTVAQLWNGNLTSNLPSVTVTNMSYNGALPANGTTTFGFIGTWNNSTNTVPALSCT